MMLRSFLIFLSLIQMPEVGIEIEYGNYAGAIVYSLIGYVFFMLGTVESKSTKKGR